MIEAILLAVYLALMAFVVAMTLIQLHLAVRLGRNPGAPATSAVEGEWPPVLVQLPVYNERYVVERLMDAVSRLDYPADRLEIQILDDSTDDTTQIVAGMTARLEALGLTVSHVVRDNRNGFKAGALAEGLRRTRQRFVAIFDADFVPDPAFIKRVLGYFADERVAAVQTRWAYLNEDQSFLTRLYVFMLNLHFRVEQPARSAAGYLMNFNGTAGIWRRAAIEAAGGWRDASLTEDLDLSYRAQLAGWRLVYLDDYATPSEVPADMSGIRSQQHRWVKGGAECARLHLSAILRARLPLPVRLNAVAHLGSSSIYAVMLCAILVSVPLSLLENSTVAVDYAYLGLPLIASTLALGWVLWRAQDRQRYAGVLGGLRFAALFPVFVVFFLGLTVQNGIAVAEGWLKRKSPFVRTPKVGAREGGVGTAGNLYASRRLDRIVWIELMVLVPVLAALVHGVLAGAPWLVPFHAMVAMGLTAIIGLTVHHWHRQREPVPRAAPDAAPTGGDGL